LSVKTQSLTTKVSVQALAKVLSNFVPIRKESAPQVPMSAINGRPRQRGSVVTYWVTANPLLCTTKIAVESRRAEPSSGVGSLSLHEPLAAWINWWIRTQRMRTIGWIFLDSARQYIFSNQLVLLIVIRFISTCHNSWRDSKRALHWEITYARMTYISGHMNYL
jgi:hypothetical protein